MAGLASPIVVDNGSGMMKAGFAGADLPESVFQTYVGRAKYDRYLLSSLRAGTTRTQARTKDKHVCVDMGAREP